MMHRHKHSRSTYICSSTAKHLPDACPYIQYSTDTLVSAVCHTISEEVGSVAFAPEPLRDTLSSLIDEKKQLINTFTKENKWLSDFDISDDFELDRSTAKHLIQRIDVFPEGKNNNTWSTKKDAGF